MFHKTTMHLSASNKSFIFTTLKITKSVSKDQIKVQIFEVKKKKTKVNLYNLFQQCFVLNTVAYIVNRKFRKKYAYMQFASLFEVLFHPKYSKQNTLYKQKLAEKI